jgi:hypothetical protein
MEAVSFPARQARGHYRHELRTLTYVTLNDANGGIIRNLNHEGVAVQAVGALRPQERVRLRFELRLPRLRVETVGQVSWATPSGQCGIRFVDLPARTRQQINEWIFSNLLDAIGREAAHPRSMFGAAFASIAREEKIREENVREGNAPEENDGLTLSAAPRPTIRMQASVPSVPVLKAQVLNSGDLVQDFAEHRLAGHVAGHPLSHLADRADDPYTELNWLSQPLSGRSLCWLVDSLVVIAAVLMFALIFLSIAHELPPWPITLATVAAAVVAAVYWGVFAIFGGSSLGARLAQTVSKVEEEESEDTVRIR